MASFPIQMTTCDAETGETISTTTVRAGIMPAPDGTCPACATPHDPGEPHNAQSLHYHYSFYAEHDRWPDWNDAMAHCSQEVRDLWTAQLTALGVDVAAGGISPARL